MSDFAIKVENLSKQYRLGTVGTGTLSHDLNRFWAKIRGKEDPYLQVGQVNDRTTKAESDYVWALKDINFEVKKGEILGIIGKNGAGKSTLLKILSRVTSPTTGSVKMNGRVGSLLEVGTGFHPELTGRENIFLNGAILGMRKWEIQKKLDEIVDFSGCEKYLDTPVKRYSSGMTVRLGFAVAAHLEPEILIVDEVLAVGDAEFQKKCIGKMQDVSRNYGRTILFVSHNLQSINRLCSSLLVLAQGSTNEKFLDLSKGLNHYKCMFSSIKDRDQLVWERTSTSFNSPWFTPEKISLQNIEGEVISPNIELDETLIIVIEFQLEVLSSDLTIGYCIYNEFDEVLFWSYQTDLPEEKWPKLSIGENKIHSKIPINILKSGPYRLELIGGLHCKEWFFKPGDINNPVLKFELTQRKNSSPYLVSRRPTLISPLVEWGSDCEEAGDTNVSYE